MNDQLKLMKAHAETFDLLYIQGTKNSHFNVFCGSETLIKDYLILKSVSTSDLRSTIILAPWEIKLLKNDFSNKLINAELDNLCKRYVRRESIVFNNGSKIDFIDYDDLDIKFRGLQIDLIYVTNSALDKIYNKDDVLLYTTIAHHGRIIYNFDSI